MKKLLLILVLATIGALGHAKAEGFSVGVAAGFPTLLEARVAYETDSFGVRGYVTTFFDVVIGADGYFRFVTDGLGSSFRLGVGAWAFLGPSFNYGVRALLGAVLAFSPGFSLALEFRPGVPLGSAFMGSGDVVLSTLLLFSTSIGFEFKF